MKKKSLIIIFLLSLLFIGCGNSKQNNLSQSKKNLLLQPFNLIITATDELNQGVVNDMYHVIGEKLEKFFPDRVILQKEISPHGIKIDVTLTQVDYVASVIRFFFKENSGEAILKVKVEITDLYKEKLIHEAFLNKKSTPRRGKGKSTSDHIDEVADDIVFMLISSNLR